jgi:hypothetical protein
MWGIRWKGTNTGLELCLQEGYTATPEGQARLSQGTISWREKLRYQYTGLQQWAAGSPLVAKLVPITIWEAARDAPYYVFGNPAAELPPHMVEGAVMPGGLPPCCTSSFVVAAAREVYKQHGGKMGLGDRTHTQLQAPSTTVAEGECPGGLALCAARLCCQQGPASRTPRTTGCTALHAVW